MNDLNLLILNDTHIGAVRNAGTTIPSRMAIQDYLHRELAELLTTNLDRDAAFIGDLFDQFDVELGQVLQCYLTLDTYIKCAKDYRGVQKIGRPVKLHLVLGNHDIAKNSTKTSSFAFLCRLLHNAHPDNVFVYDDGLAKIEEGVWVIPHCTNQDLFDLELAEALMIPPSYLFLHANCDNNFALEADHSLNVPDEMVRKLVAHGHTLVFAHEHQRRNLHAGQVRIMGNQWPTSVADCLSHGDAQKDGTKYAHTLVSTYNADRTEVSLSMAHFPTWQAEGDYIEMDWRNLEPTDHRFIRVAGDAKADESSDVINAVHRFRLSSQALVITNAVKIEGISGLEEMSSLTQDGLAAINIMEALLDELTPQEGAVVKELYSGRPQ